MNYTDVTEGDKVTRTFHKFDYAFAFEGNYQFSTGDVAVYKKRGKYGLDLHSFEDEPAIRFTNGTKLWFVNGREGRMDGKPCKVFANGAKVWIDLETSRFLKSEP